MKKEIFNLKQFNPKEALDNLTLEMWQIGEFKKTNVQTLSHMLFTATLAFHHPKLVLDNLAKDRLGELNTLLDVLLKGIAKEAK